MISRTEATAPYIYFPSEGSLRNAMFPQCRATLRDSCDLEIRLCISIGSRAFQCSAGPQCIVTLLQRRASCAAVAQEKVGFLRTAE